MVLGRGVFSYRLWLVCVSERVLVWQASNILFVDQPVGTGFSYSTNSDDIRHNEEGVSNDLYDFLQVLMITFC